MLLQIFPSLGGTIAQWLAYFLPDPAAPAMIPRVHAIFYKEKIVNVAEDYRRRCLEESGQWLENVDQTHLVLVFLMVKRPSNNFYPL